MLGTAMSTDATEDDIWTSRAQKKPTSAPPSAQVSRRSRSVLGTLVLPGRRSGGQQRGLGGHVKFADRDLERDSFGFGWVLVIFMWFW